MKIALVAAEPSGDKLGALLIAALRQRHPSAQIIGVGGELMRAAGCQLFGHIDQLSVMGIVEVLRQYPRLRALQRATTAELLQQRPDVFVGVDAPDYNLPIAAKLKAAGIRCVHFISPTVWAWRAGRVHQVARACDLLLSIYPFEADYYRSTNLRVEYIGHPLADAIALEPDAEAARARLKLRPTNGTRLIALLPGSRSSELQHHARLFALVAHKLQESLGNCHFLLVAANASRAQQLRELIPELLSQPELCTLVVQEAQTALAAADCALLVSGTVSLEALLSKTPMVVAYKTSTLSYWILKALVRSKYVAQPNWLAGHELVPEFVQSAASFERLSAAMLELLQRPDHDQLQQSYRQIHQLLKRDACTRAADLILALPGAAEERAKEALSNSQAK